MTNDQEKAVPAQEPSDTRPKTATVEFQLDLERVAKDVRTYAHNVTSHQLFTSLEVAKQVNTQMRDTIAALMISEVSNRCTPEGIASYVDDFLRAEVDAHVRKNPEVKKKIKEYAAKRMAEIINEKASA